MILVRSSFWLTIGTVDIRLPARGWGLRQKRCLPFLLRGLSTSLSLRHSVSLTCQVWNQLRIELPRSRTPLLAFVLTNGLAIAYWRKLTYQRWSLGGHSLRLHVLSPRFDKGCLACTTCKCRCYRRTGTQGVSRSQTLMWLSVTRAFYY